MREKRAALCAVNVGGTAGAAQLLSQLFLWGGERRFSFAVSPAPGGADGFPHANRFIFHDIPTRTGMGNPGGSVWGQSRAPEARIAELF